MTTHHDSPLFEPAQPDPAFRARLRAQFVSGEIGAAAADVRDRASLAPYLAAEEPSPAFAAELRERFVRGDLEEREPVHELRPAARVFPLHRRTVLVTTLAAAAALLLFLAFGFERSDGWRIFNHRATALLVDDAEFSGDVLRPGTRPCLLCTDAGNLRLGYGDDLRLELAAHTRVRMPEPRREGERIVLPVRVEAGELVIISRLASGSSSVTIETENAYVTLHGTSVSVLPLPNGHVCVCVQAGEVEVESKRGERSKLTATAGQRVMAQADGTLLLSEEYDNEKRLRNLSAACSDIAEGRFESPEYDRSWNALEDF
ncbi:hypothetical protein Pla163_27160 [Planctomycetes bacterium Pla163]|uniref:FecR protein n=1 Tax=Rohdeia mirabilis TaxID=2528008 RepID=A0A518D286_9BACT|nr:hypothetical protein Pla163_27160 [Planctomycetes bacterium Pla163]